MTGHSKSSGSSAASEADGDAAPSFRADQLVGFRIAVTSDRRSEDLIAAFERRGAEVVHAPTIRMAGATDEAALSAETREVIERRPDFLLATTSYGMSRWLDAADAEGTGEDLVRVLAGSRILVRGPKARGAIRAAGLDDDGMSERETTTSLVDLVLREDIRGRTVAVQLHGFTDTSQLARLTRAGATVLMVAPYRWTAHEDSSRVVRLIELVCSQGIDAVTFTSAPAVEALFSVADSIGRLGDLHTAFRESVVAAAVGPVTAAPLVAASILPIVPDRFRMGAMIRLVCAHLENVSTLRVATTFGGVELRGRLVSFGGDLFPLSPIGLALFRTLMAAGGKVVSRGALADAAPERLDDHGVDVAMSRLRQSLPQPGIIATVIKRGYRIAVPV